MYEFLRRFLPERAAGVVLAMWYMLLILAVLLNLEWSDNAFRYGAL